MMSDKKKLMLFSHVCNSRNITGAEKLLLFLARNFSPYFDCTIVMPREGRLTQLAAEAGVRTVIRELPLMYGIFTPYEGLIQDIKTYIQTPGCREAIALLQDERPDYVFVNTCVNVMPAIAAKSLGIPVIWHITEVITDTAYIHHAIHTIDRYSDLIICISNSAMAPFLGYQIEHKLALLYPSWNDDELNSSEWQNWRRKKRMKWGISANETLIGYISSFLTPEKGADHFIRAATLIGAAHPETRFVIIGGEFDKEFTRKLRRLVTHSGIKHRFLFVDHEQNIEAAYCAMDIVVIPGLVREGFGLTALEAMAFSKPVVAYASGGLEEILTSVGSGYYLAPPGDVEELAYKARELLKTPDLAEQVGRANQHGAITHFGKGAYGERVQEMIRRIQGLSGSQVPLPPSSEPPQAAPQSFVEPGVLPVKSKARRTQGKSGYRRRLASARRRKRKAGVKSRSRRRTTKRLSQRLTRRRSSRRHRGVRKSR